MLSTNFAIINLGSGFNQRKRLDAFDKLLSERYCKYSNWVFFRVIGSFSDQQCAKYSAKNIGVSNFYWKKFQCRLRLWKATSARIKNCLETNFGAMNINNLLYIQLIFEKSKIWSFEKTVAFLKKYGLLTQAAIQRSCHDKGQNSLSRHVCFVRYDYIYYRYLQNKDCQRPIRGAEIDSMLSRTVNLTSLILKVAIPH